MDKRVTAAKDVGGDIGSVGLGRLKHLNQGGDS